MREAAADPALAYRAVCKCFFTIAFGSPSLRRVSSSTTVCSSLWHETNISLSHHVAVWIIQSKTQTGAGNKPSKAGWRWLSGMIHGHTAYVERMFSPQNLWLKNTTQQNTQKVLKCDHREACKTAFSVTTAATHLINTTQMINTVLVQYFLRDGCRCGRDVGLVMWFSFSDAKNTIVFTSLGLLVLEGEDSRSRAWAAVAEGLTMASKLWCLFFVSATLGCE